MSNKLFVGNISFRASEEDVKELFSQAGEVLSARLVKDTATGKSKGFGFVEMATDAQAEKAISMFNGSSFMNRNLVVDRAKPQQPRQRGGRFRQRGERRREA